MDKLNKRLVDASKPNAAGHYFIRDEARKQARQTLGGVAQGEDPAEERRVSWTSPSMASLCERFLSDYVPQHYKASAAEEYRRSVDLFTRPALGQRRVVDLGRSDIAQLYHDMWGKPYQANRTLGILSVIFNQAQIWGLRAMTDFG